MTPQIRLVIAACHASVASALLRRIAAASDGPVDGTCVTGIAELGAGLRDGGQDIAVVDGDLAGLDAAGAVGALRAAQPRRPIVVLLARCDPAAELALARAGASATVAWSAPTGFLLRILRIVAAGSSAMSTDALLAAAPPRPAPLLGAGLPVLLQPGRPIEPLTERETTILARIRRGQSNRAIGDALGIDENRVKIHLRAIFRKTGARNRTEAALRASAAPPPAPVPAPVQVAA